MEMPIYEATVLSSRVDGIKPSLVLTCGSSSSISKGKVGAQEILEMCLNGVGLWVPVAYTRSCVMGTGMRTLDWDFR